MNFCWGCQPGLWKQSGDLDPEARIEGSAATYSKTETLIESQFSFQERMIHVNTGLSSVFKVILCGISKRLPVL